MPFDRHLSLPYLRYVHGAYNTVMMILFTYHGLLGLKIRKERKRKGPFPLAAIKRHRKTGPVLTILGILGFFIGFTLVYVEFKNLLKYPLHLSVGLVLVLSLASTFIVSRKIKGSESPWRTRHFILGIFILCLYYINVLIGLGILL